MTDLSTLASEIANRRYPEFKFQITEQWVRDYKTALGLSFAQIADSNYVPNSFVSCLRDAEFWVFASLDMELSQLLHASQTYEFLNSIKVGDEISSQSQIAKVSHKKGSRGEMLFVDIKNTFKRLRNNGVEEPTPVPLVNAVMSLVVRPKQ